MAIFGRKLCLKTHVNMVTLLIYNIAAAQAVASASAYAQPGQLNTGSILVSYLRLNNIPIRQSPS